jgi:hypothetical protein
MRVAVVPVVLPITMTWATVLAPKAQLMPVPQFIDTVVAPVLLPMVIVLALALVPILIAPVVPESSVSALLVVDWIDTVDPPVIARAAVDRILGVVMLVATPRVLFSVVAPVTVRASSVLSTLAESRYRLTSEPSTSPPLLPWAVTLSWPAELIMTLSIPPP